MGEMANRNGRSLQAQTASLIRAAQRHHLGTDFLLHGSLDAVAATFQVHAFAVDAARERLRSAATVETMALEPAGAAAQ